ncbi:MAG TPA: hypothetical protein VN696_13650 [Pyrinomonadaceae bacterium]|jgi:Ni/Co efflux regulator RcnB|nr:hypothetical protein [Pyrinomonadaceae bacterium]
MKKLFIVLALTLTAVFGGLIMERTAAAQNSNSSTTMERGDRHMNNRRHMRRRWRRHRRHYRRRHEMHNKNANQ